MKCARRHQLASAIVIILGAVILLVTITHQAHTQVSSDLVNFSYQTFSQVAAVYRAGGGAPELVAKLNVALDLMQNATLRRLEGDQTNAARFEDQARSTLTEIMNQAPEAQQRAESESSMRTLFLLPWIPAVVLLSTFLFYAALRTWRWYEKMKLFEMEILEKKKED